MGSRFKKYQFKKFTGRGQKFYDEKDPFKYYYDDGIYIDSLTGRYKPSPFWIYSTLTGCQLDTSNNQIASLGGNILFGVSKSDNTEVRIYKITAIGGTPTLTYTFSNSSHLYYALAVFNKFIVWHYDDVATTIKLSYSDENGASFTDVAWSESSSPISHCILDKKLYVALADKILVSSDGQTFETYATAPSGYSFTKIIPSGGFIFGVMVQNDNIYKIVRVIYDGSLVDIRTISASGGFDIIDSDDKTIVVAKSDGDTVVIYKYNTALGEMTKLISIDTMTLVDVELFYFDSNEVFLMCRDSLTPYIEHTYIIRPTTDQVFEFHDLSSGFDITSFVPFKETIYMLAKSDTEDPRIYYISWGDFVVGSIILPIIELFGEVPRSLILHHAPLPEAVDESVASVEVWVKEDRATSWTKILTSNTKDSVKAVYNFPVGKNLDYIQFMTIITGNDDDEVPSDISLDFLTVPIGLINSK
jgi:hypothetical protein